MFQAFQTLKLRLTAETPSTPSLETFAIRTPRYEISLCALGGHQSFNITPEARRARSREFLIEQYSELCELLVFAVKFSLSHTLNDLNWNDWNAARRGMGEVNK